MSRLSSKHLEEAVASRVITSDQRKGILDLATRDGAGRMPEDKAAAADDEPFEIFQGFAEIFVALGLVIVLAGVGGLIEAMVVQGLSPFVLLVMSCGLGHYYARHRRMTLPSIVSLLGIVTGFVWLFAAFVDGADLLGGSTPAMTLLASLATFGLLLLCYRGYRLPFTMFLAGASLLVAILSSIELVSGGGKNLLSDDFFDLRENAMQAFGVLGFGIIALAAALYFDLKDPMRTGGASKTAFWLHIQASPAIVNTVTLTLFNVGGMAGHVLTVLMLVCTAFLSLVIDRRSFMTAGLVYIGAVLGFYTDAFGDNAFFVNALIIGLLVTSLGTWWRGLRQIVMSALPYFPGKHALAPYMPADRP